MCVCCSIIFKWAVRISCYFLQYMQAQPQGPRQRVPYPGNEGQPGQAGHGLPPHHASFLTTQFGKCSLLLTDVTLCILIDCDWKYWSNFMLLFIAFIFDCVRLVLYSR